MDWSAAFKSGRLSRAICRTSSNGAIWLEKSKWARHVESIHRASGRSGSMRSWIFAVSQTLFPEKTPPSARRSLVRNHGPFVRRDLPIDNHLAELAFELRPALLDDGEKLTVGMIDGVFQTCRSCGVIWPKGDPGRLDLATLDDLASSRRFSRSGPPGLETAA